ncbi:unnamed protein product, partial [Mesorhabditis spiculigera]
MDIEPVSRAFNYHQAQPGIPQLLHYGYLWYARLHIYLSIIFFGSHMLLGGTFECWGEQNLSPSWIQYASARCFYGLTYVAKTYDINTGEVTSIKHHHGWYAFVPIYFLIFGSIPQFLSFLFANLSKCPIDLARIVYSVKRTATISCEDTVDMRNLSVHLIRAHHVTNPNSRHNCFIHDLIEKALFCLMMIIEWCFCSYFLGYPHFWPIEKFQHQFMSNPDYPKQEYFSRKVMCETEVAAEFDVRTYQFQCFMNGNVVYEQIFYVKWFYSIVLIVSGAIDIVYTLCEVGTPRLREYYIRNLHLLVPSLSTLLRSTKSEPSKKLSARFVKWLGTDEIYTLYRISKHVHWNYTAAILDHLYKVFLDEKEFAAKKVEEPKKPRDEDGKLDSVEEQNGIDPTLCC